MALTRKEKAFLKKRPKLQQFLKSKEFKKLSAGLGREARALKKKKK